MEKKEEEQVYGILSLLLLPFAMLSCLWTTYILWDISVLFELTYLTQYGYELFFGSALVFSVFLPMSRQLKNEPAKKAVGNFLGRQFAWFAIWGSAYLYHWLLRF